MKLKMSLQYLRILYELQCKHQEKYMKPTNPLTWNPDDCEDCVLAHMPWRPKLGAMKDLCFLIWRGKILDKKRR